MPKVNLQCPDFRGIAENVSRRIDHVAFYAFSYENSLNTTLRLEASRYNDLLGRISTSLNLLRRALKGEVIMSFTIENTFECVANRQVPEKWREVRSCWRCKVVLVRMMVNS